MTFDLAAGEQRRLDVALAPEPPPPASRFGYAGGLGDGLPLPARRLEAMIQLGGGLDGDRGPGGGVVGSGFFGGSYTIDGFDVGDPLGSGLGARILESGLVGLSTEPAAFDPDASFSSGAATNLVTRTGSNRPEFSLRAGTGAGTGAASGWLSDFGTLLAGPVVKDQSWFSGALGMLWGRTPSANTAAAISGLGKLTWQMGGRHRLSLLMLGDRTAEDERVLRESRLVGARLESLLSDAVVARAQLGWRDGSLAAGRFVGPEAALRGDWFMSDRHGSALAVTARGSVLEVDRPGATAGTAKLERSLVHLEYDWRFTRHLTLELGATWSGSRFRRDGGQVLGGSGRWPAPQVALAWDATADGRTVVRLSAVEVVDPGSLTTGEAALAAAPVACRPGTRELAAGVEREVIPGTAVGLDGGSRWRPCRLPGDARSAWFRHIGFHVHRREGRFSYQGRGHLESAPGGTGGRVRLFATAALIPGLSVAGMFGWDDRRAWAPLMDPFLDPGAVLPDVPAGGGRQTIVAGAQAWFFLGHAFGLPWVASTEAFAAGRQGSIRLRLALLL